MFWQHDTREPIGSWLDFSEDGKGLFMEGRLNMDVQRAREAHALLKAGDVEGLSIGYEVIKAEPDKDVLRLTELRLFEVSVVSLAANERATVTAVKAEDIELRNRLAAGDRLTVREWERLLKEHLSLSNSEAERAVRLHLRGGSGDPGADDGIAFLRALTGITN
jgi:phage head maturation protease